MRVVAWTLVAVSMVLTPFAPTTAAPAIQIVAAQACRMPCCHAEHSQPAKKSSMPGCHCPVACVIPVQATAILPFLTSICPPKPCLAANAFLSDESAPERNLRPPVPPPRA